jgi:hypothetical protein
VPVIVGEGVEKRRGLLVHAVPLPEPAAEHASPSSLLGQ